MPPRKKSTPEINTKDYRHPEEHRTNIPPAKIAAEGEVPKVKKAKYYYSPHLSPELRFDPTGKADRVLSVCEKAAPYLDKDELELLKAAMNAHQPWLEWAGKREEMERGHFEVDPVALHIHERVSAQAIVRAAMREDMQRDLFADPELPYQKEVQFYKHDIDWANRLILGDSLQVMSSLAKRENLAGKVQMIYIDPPYGIRYASNFQSEIKKREVKDNQRDLTREPEMVRAYRDTWNLGIHSYVEYMRSRLLLARELLCDDGSLFLQISNENVHLIRTIMDDILGSNNFISEIIFIRGVAGLGDYVSNINDYILWYAKDKEKAKRKYKNIFNLRSKKTLDNAYNYIESQYGSIARLSTLDTDEISNIRFKSSALVAREATDSGSFDYNYSNEIFKLPPNTHWKTSKVGLKRLCTANRLHGFGKTLIYKMYSTDFPFVPISNVWDDVFESTFAVQRYYVVQTPAKVIERCLLMTTDPGDLVLDPTCGSGTTAFVAEQWGRRWITIDTSRVAISIARQRILTARYDHYKLRDEKKGPAGGFFYKTVPHITLKSIAQNTNLDPIFAKHEPILDKALEACNAALVKVNDTLRQKLSWKLMDKQKAEGKRAVTDADRRRWELPVASKKGVGGEGVFQHWTVPFDTDPDWPRELVDAVTAYRAAWRAKMDEVNKCIEDNAEQEDLVDKPETVKGIVRVSGPFTVEGVRPAELSLGEDTTYDEVEGTSSLVAEARDEVQNLRAYLSRMVGLLSSDGVTFPNNKHRAFARVEALYEEKTGAAIHAEALWKGGDESGPNTVAIAFGPQYGPVTAEQVEDCIRASKRYDEIVIAGFSFDAAATAAIQEASHPKLTVHMAHIRPDVSPGMDGLLKETPNSQLFTVFGQPEIKVKKNRSGEYAVELLGVDIFDPVKGEVRSTGADKVAAWFLDSDYDGRCFCVTQAFFPDQNAWEKIAKSLGSQADPEAFEAFAGTVSLPFEAGRHRRVAVKVIDPRGNEVMCFAALEAE